MSCGNVGTYFAQLGWWGPVAFIVVAIFCILCFVPRTVFGVIGGILFGFLWGMAVHLLIATTAALLGYHVSRRYFPKSWIEAMRRRHWFEKIRTVSAGSPLSLVSFSHLIHVLNFNACNLSWGLMGVSLRDFVWGTLLGIFPGTVAMTYAGKVFGCAYFEGETSSMAGLRLKFIVATALLAIAALIPIVLKRSRQKSIADHRRLP